MKRTVAVGVLILTAVLGLRAAGQVDSRRRAEEEQRRALEAEQRAREAAKLEDAQSSLQAKRDEITKAVSDLGVLRAKCAELELTIRKLRDELAQEEAALREREEKAREKVRENLRALDASIVRFKEDQGRGGEEKLDTILKRLESIEKRLSDLEKKVQPSRQKK
jgi:hypothetical protein